MVLRVFCFKYDIQFKIVILRDEGEILKYEFEYNEKLQPTKYKDKELGWKNGRLNNYDNIYFNYLADGTRTQKGVFSEEYNNNGEMLFEKVTSYDSDNGNIYKENNGHTGKDLVFIEGTEGKAGFYYEGEACFYRKNIFGDVIEIYKDGEAIARYEYDAWGNHKVLNPDGSENKSSTFIGNINPIRYRGYYYDRETKLYYCNSRYYDPETGRWISMDSIEYLDPYTLNGVNLYVYCNNNPIMYADPSGHFVITTFLICLGVGALVGGTLGGITAYSEGQDILTGILTGALLGATVGAVVGIGVDALLSGAVSSVLSKTAIDLISVSFYGGEFGGWEDYAIAFAFGGLTGYLGNVAGKFAADVALRPGANQLVKWGTRGDPLNGDKYLYDVITRAVTYGGSNNVMKSNMFGLNLKVDLGKCFYRSTFRSLYSYI